MKPPKPPAPKQELLWQNTPHANLVRYVPSETYFARIRVGGKLIRRSLKTKVLSVAKLRLADLEKAERQANESASALEGGKMIFADALKIYLDRLAGDASLKPRTKAYYKECVSKLFQTWPEINSMDVRRVTKSLCLNWSAELGRNASPTVYNHTVGMLRRILDIAIESGSLYDNPARFIKRLREYPKPLKLPSHLDFQRLVQAIEDGKVCSCYLAADLVRFLAFGGFRRSEAKHVTWADCDFVKKEITVRGDPVTGTKNSQVRRIPMISEMVELLNRLKGERPDENPAQPVMKIQECQISIDRAAKLTGIVRITHHDLRHLFATRCIESGVDVPTLSRWMGHKDGGALAMRIYGHLRDAHSSAMASKVSFS